MQGVSRSGGVSAPRYAALNPSPRLVNRQMFNFFRRPRVVSLASPAAAAPPVGQVVLRISIPYGTSPGEIVRLVGGSQELGDWNVEQGMDLQWTEGNNWVGEIPLKPGQKYEFKGVVYNPTTKAQKWEDGGNRSVEVPADATTASVSVDCLWGKPSDMPSIDFGAATATENGTAASAAAPDAASWSIGSAIASAAAASIAKMNGTSAPAAITGPAADGMVTARFLLPYTTSIGEVVRLVGGSEEMGNWDAENGRELTWTEGNVWVADVPLKAGQQYEFKMVVFNTSTKAQKWEAGENRRLDVPAEGNVVALNVDCVWCSTVDMIPEALKSADGDLAVIEDKSLVQETSAVATDLSVSAAAAVGATEEDVKTAASAQASAAPEEATSAAPEPVAIKAEEAPKAAGSSAAAAAAPASTPSETTAEAGSNAGAAIGFVLAVVAAAAAYFVAGPQTATRPDLSTVTASLSKSVSSSVAGLSASTSALSDTLAAHTETVAKMVDTHVGTLASTTKQAVEGLATASDSVAGAVSQGIDGLSSVADAVSQGIDDLSAATSAGVDSLSATTSSLTSSLSSSIPSIGSDVADAGADRSADLLAQMHAAPDVTAAYERLVSRS